MTKESLSRILELRKKSFKDQESLHEPSLEVRCGVGGFCPVGRSMRQGEADRAEPRNKSEVCQAGMSLGREVPLSVAKGRRRTYRCLPNAFPCSTVTHREG